MKNQKLVIISVVLAILFLAILGTVVILNDNVSAATSSCNHKWGPWENTGVGVHVRYCTKDGCDHSQGQECDDYSSWVAHDEDIHWWKCSVCGSVTMPREHTFVNGACKDCGKAQPGCSHSAWKLAWNSNYHWNECVTCEEELFGKETHTYVSGECVTCGYDCTHPSYVSGKCTKCGEAQPGCSHASWKLTWDNNYHWNACISCGDELFGKETHTYVRGECVTCGYDCTHPSYVSGKCTKCGETEPGCSHSAWRLVWDSNNHWNACISCGEELFGKETHKYVSGECITCGYDCTHPSYASGKCTKCGEAEPGCSHASWKLTWDNNYHWNACISCGDELFGKETHKYVNGTCTICTYKCSHSELAWQNSETEHWQTCKNCQGEVTGTRSKHTYNNGTCTKCTYKCEHKELVWQNSETEHWQTCKNCQGEVAGTRNNHTYNNGTCTTCTYKCEHKEAEWQRNEKEHWQTCKNCLSEIKDTRVVHSVKEWKDQGNGTHTGACEKCEKQLQENHNYVENKCKCGATKKEEAVECKHSEQKWLAISTEHWKVCKNCEVEITGTRENHTFENGTCKECNYKCKHKNIVYKNNQTEHWQECVNCLDEIDGTREAHSYENGKCTECTSEQKVEDENTQKPSDSENEQNKNEDTANKDDVNQDKNQTNKDDTTQKDNNVADNKQDTTQKTDKIPDTGRKENMQIAIMITAAVIGCALLINLSREE